MPLWCKGHKRVIVNATVASSNPARGNMLLNIFISSLWYQGKARLWVLPLNMQWHTRINIYCDVDYILLSVKNKVDTTWSWKKRKNTHPILSKQQCMMSPTGHINHHTYQLRVDRRVSHHDFGITLVSHRPVPEATRQGSTRCKLCQNQIILFKAFNLYFNNIILY